MDHRQKEFVGLPKTPSGIPGLDEITMGGLAQGRPTLVCGGPGAGKTLLATQFLACGADQLGENGVLISFQESAEDLATNARSLGFRLGELERRRKLVIDYVRLDRHEIEETGEYNLEGLFIRIAEAIRRVNARRVALDSLEALFSGLRQHAILRAELRRLFQWFQEQRITTIVTAERGNDSLTPFGIEEYIADCVILLDHRIDEEVSTRYLRVLKYRGSSHSSNEFPFLISDRGISVFPITSVRLQSRAPSARVSTGVARLDTMLAGKGYYQGSSVLISGTAGCGKTSFASAFAASVCRSGRRCTYFAFEESPGQLVRNMRSIGINLDRWIRRKLLTIHSEPPTACGLEEHLLGMREIIERDRPAAVIIDPLSNLTNIGEPQRVRRMLTRLLTLLKAHEITTVCTSLLHDTSFADRMIGISSTMDTLLMLTNIQAEGERNRGVYILKARGIAHSNQVREFRLSKNGIEMLDVYLGPGGALTGSARAVEEARRRETVAEKSREEQRQRFEIGRRRAALKAQMDALRAQIESEQAAFNLELSQEQNRRSQAAREHKAQAHARMADVDGAVA